jgi:hypothetical protein
MESVRDCENIMEDHVLKITSREKQYMQLARVSTEGTKWKEPSSILVVGRGCRPFGSGHETGQLDHHLNTKVPLA